MDLAQQPELTASEKVELNRYLDGIEFWYKNYGEVKTNFDPSFVMAIAAKHRNGRDVTRKQFNAVKVIYFKWVKT